MSQLCITLVYRGQSGEMKCRILSGGLFRGETDLVEESLIEKTGVLPADRVHIFVKTIPSPESHNTIGMLDVNLGSTQLSDTLSVLPVWRVFEQVDHTISIRIKVYDEFMTYVMWRLDEKPMTVTASTPSDHAAGEPGSDLVLGDFKYRGSHLTFSKRTDGIFSLVLEYEGAPSHSYTIGDESLSKYLFERTCCDLVAVESSYDRMISRIENHLRGSL